MRFINNGPNIPEPLIQAQEDGKVVFFCGAGISMQAGIPGFEQLTEDLFSAMGMDPTPVEQSARTHGRFEQAIDLLERRVGDRAMVRSKLQKLLKPANPTNPATSTHQALLTLAKDKQDTLRLVTTNFDRLFFEVDPTLRSYVAPLLPIPKRTKWNGLVHLHGLLPKDEEQSALNSLVLSSGDFGLAYLVERWASRFVTELFRNYIVCFVGYRIEDPVLRYMLDALAADKIQGEALVQVFAFGDHKEGSENQTRDEWLSKGVSPLLYCNEPNHDLLHRTLREWANTYRDGLNGKRAIITRDAFMTPSCNLHDDHVARVMWALCDPSGMTAKTFADLDPVPPIEWLEVFTAPRFTPAEVSVFGGAGLSSHDGTPSSSMLRRPAPAHCSTDMVPVTTGDPEWMLPRLDETMTHLVRWMCRHLNQPRLLRWVIAHGCLLHPYFRNRVLDQLKTFPPTVPESLVVLWRLICAGLCTSANHNYSMPLYRWHDNFNKFGWGIQLKRELIHMLHPRVRLREPLSLDSWWDEAQPGAEIPTTRSVRDYVSWDIVLSTGDHPWDKLHKLQEHADWKAIAAECLPEFTSCLRECLQLMEALGDASSRQDSSYITRPSISNHAQNNSSHSWTALISLCRDAWITTATHAPLLARAQLEQWNAIKFPLFKRLVFHIATESPLISEKEGLSFLIQDSAWWLWSPHTKSEAFRLMLHLGKRLVNNDRDQLFSAFLADPPITMFRADVDEQSRNRSIDHSVWLRLKHLERAGAGLTSESQQRLEDISQRFPQWQIQPDDRDYFPFWMEMGSRDIRAQPKTLPRESLALIEALKHRPTDDSQYTDNWEDICRTEPNLAIDVLQTLGKEHCWKVDIWRDALNVFIREGATVHSLEQLGPVLCDLPPAVMSEFPHTFSTWLKVLTPHVSSLTEGVWFQLIDKVLQNADTELNETDQDAVGAAINNPLGIAVQAIFDFWYQSGPTENAGLPETVRSRLEQLTASTPAGHAHGRVIVARNLTSLFAVDPAWTANIFLPALKWVSNPTEAKRMWIGYLYVGRISPGFFDAVKTDFLDTAGHYNDLESYSMNYAALLTIVALDYKGHFQDSEMRKAYTVLPTDGLAESVRTIGRFIIAADDRRAEYWTNRVKPFFELLWPKTSDKKNGNLSIRLAELCISAGPFFEQAVTFLKPYLVKTTDFYSPVHRLAESQLAKRYPKRALTLLHEIVDEVQRWPSPELQTCLDDISSANSTLTATPQFRRLHEYWMRSGGEGT